jgi:hypothetical protein
MVKLLADAVRIEDEERVPGKGPGWQMRLA